LARAKGGGSIFFAVISAIEQALWDIKGKALNVPVYEMLGGRIRDQVRVYANGWFPQAIGDRPAIRLVRPKRLICRSAEHEPDFLGRRLDELTTENPAACGRNAALDLQVRPGNRLGSDTDPHAQQRALQDRLDCR
jgi:L-alanine-DL-glutamate epimerase-like enolase superfamily enzyme